MTESRPLAAASIRAVLIFGPTASGKSALAVAVARRMQQRGLAPIVVNADALQVYRGWDVLTARPDAAALGQAEHALYGHVDETDLRYSAGRWLREVEALAATAAQDSRPLIVVGGTGLYFKVLTGGLAPIPEVSRRTRGRVEREIETLGLSAAVARLRAEDPESADRVDLRNPRRVLRALEVLDQTGRGLAAWARATPPPLLTPDQVVRARLVLDRDILRARIADRLRIMVRSGALDEVAAMTAKIECGALDPHAPAMQALGAEELSAHLRGEVGLEDAIEAAAVASGRYAKRQDTWGRNQLRAWPVFARSGEADTDAVMQDMATTLSKDALAL